MGPLKLPYTRLDHGHRIRILVLQPAPHDLPICCSLETVELDADAHYHALSYSWATEDGDASKSKAIELDGESFPVTSNLYHALLRIRSIAEPQRLWIDAVCINQNDDAEKSHQVRMMELIYSYADMVIGWLGEGSTDREDEAAYTAMRCIIAEHLEGSRWKPIYQELRLQHTWLPFSLTNEIREQCAICQEYNLTHPTRSEHYIGTPARLSELARAFVKLLRRRYFKRRWIIQEINVPVSEDVIFRWGRYQLSKGDFMMGQNIPSPSLGIPDDIFALRGILTCGEPSSLIELLGCTNTTVCTDPRDRVYALLSLAKNHDISIDYGRSIAEAYTLCANLFIRELRHVNLFLSCSGVQKTSEDPIPELP